MPEDSSRAFSFFLETQQRLLTAILNRIIPADDRFPGAGDLGVASYLDAVIGRSADLRRLFGEGLGQIEIVSQERYGQGFLNLPESQQETVLRQVESTHAEFFATLVLHTYSGYYTHPEVVRLLGPDVRPPQPAGYHLEPFDHGLLESVQRRGPMYRDA